MLKSFNIVEMAALDVNKTSIMPKNSSAPGFEPGHPKVLDTE